MGDVASLRARARALATALRARRDHSRHRFAAVADRLAALAALDVTDAAWRDAAATMITAHDAQDFATESGAYRSLVSDWDGVTSADARAFVAAARARIREAEAGQQLVSELLGGGRDPYPGFPGVPHVGPFG